MQHTAPDRDYRPEPRDYVRGIFDRYVATRVEKWKVFFKHLNKQDLPERSSRMLSDILGSKPISSQSDSPTQKWMAHAEESLSLFRSMEKEFQEEYHNLGEKYREAMANDPDNNKKPSKDTDALRTVPELLRLDKDYALPTQANILKHVDPEEQDFHQFVRDSFKTSEGFGSTMALYCHNQALSDLKSELNPAEIKTLKERCNYLDKCVARVLQERQDPLSPHGDRREIWR